MPANMICLSKASLMPLKGKSLISLQRYKLFKHWYTYPMDDLQRYIKQRKDLDLEFAKTFDAGYQQFKIGELMRYARERAGLTQEELAGKLNTKKLAISRIENHSENIRLSTLFHYAEALGKKLQVSIQ